MRSVTRRTRFAAFAILSISPMISGCLFGGYVYPVVQYIPPTPLRRPDADQVHAFRVDILDSSGSVEFSSADDYLFRELSLNSRGNVPAQFSARLGSGWWAFWFCHGYRQRLHPTIRVRLYRPGYETVEVRPWHWSRPVGWKAAGTIEYQEKAIDDLISTRETNDLYEISPEAWQNDYVSYSLSPPRTDAQRAALEFVIGEYRLLAGVARSQGNETASTRLLDKARLVEEVRRTEGTPAKANR